MASLNVPPSPASGPQSERIRKLIGTNIGGRYKVLALLGEGAMGLVFLVEHTIIRKRMALKVNDVLRPVLLQKGLLLVDFKLEFGRHGGKLYLGDEISPDTCRLWDAKTRQKLDKDRFRQDLGGVEDAYQEVYRRVVQGGKVA